MQSVDDGKNLSVQCNKGGDPKYLARNSKIYHVDGYELPEEEPLMIFRGKDVGSLIAIYEYICMLEDQPQNKTIVSHLESSLERLSVFYHYQINNPHLQSVGCSMRSHDRYRMFLDFAKRKLHDHGVATYEKCNSKIKFPTGFEY